MIKLKLEFFENDREIFAIGVLIPSIPAKQGNFAGDSMMYALMK